MKAFDPDPRLRWLFCMTHPDDEISICVWIKRLTRAGIEVHLSWTHSTPVREAEARAVAFILGIPQDRLHFFHGTDGSIPEEMPDLLPKFREHIQAVSPDRIACGAFEQGHLDHDSTNLLVAKSFDGPICEIPFYHTYLTRFQRLNRFADERGEERIHLVGDEQRFKQMVARQFPSQNIWSILLWYEVWHKARFKPIELLRAERMRMQGQVNYSKPQLPQKLADRVRKSPHWSRWEQALQALQKSSEI